jgi:carbamoyl-phosphate synthase large subunit
MIKNDEIDFIVNITEDKKAIADSYEIRRNALQNKVTYYTTLAGARAACIGMSYADEFHVMPLQSLHNS